MLKVLLVAPTDPDIPSELRFLVGGENTFTKSLLSNPPRNVRYTYYHEALAKGEIEYTPLHRILSILTKLRILPIGAGSQCFRIKADFDLVHCHAYGIKIDRDIPIILSDSSSNYLFLRDYVNWPWWRIKLGLVIKKLVLKAFGVLDTDVNVGNSRLIVFSKFASNIHRELGITANQMEVVYPGLSTPSLRHSGDRAKRWRPESLIIDSGRTSFARMTTQEVVNILFVGTWFERKGGPLLMEAFKRLKKKYLNIRLTVVGEVPRKIKNSYNFRRKFSTSSNNKIVQFDYISRDKLMREFFPKADIFVLIPPKVEGFGFSVLEAMSFGIPVILSRVCALPELVEDGKSGFVIKPGSKAELTDRLEILIENSILRKRMGKLARKRFEEKFSIEKSNENLLKVYRQALL